MSQPGTPEQKTVSKRATLLITLVAVLTVVIPLLFWHGTWFGRALSEDEIGEYLNSHREKPRQTQHALVQISERMSRGEASAQQWYSQVVSLADQPLPELRLTVAWVMGQDPESEVFHHKLSELVTDPHPMVRRNAALSLARFGDPAGRGEMLAMLRPHTVTAEQSGILRYRLQEGDVVDRDTLLARIEIEGQPEPFEIRSPVPGVVRKHLQQDGAAIRSEDEVMLLGPAPDHAFEALRGLFLVGKRDDIDTIRPFLLPNENIPPQVTQQARLTIDHISGAGGP